MVAKSKKSRAESPCLDVQLELDNRALKAKNNSLTQTVAKLQQDNADLLKQITYLQRESFEVNSKYNNLKNVLSIIDSTTKSCLPKLNEVAETFTGIMQLCSVAANISNFTVINTSPNKDVRTQAVKPQIVNGHILHNPTITLSRLSNDSPSHTPPRPSRLPNDNVRPSTSRGSPETSDRRPRLSLGENGDSDEENRNDNEGQDLSFRCNTSRRSSRTQLRHEEDSDDSDEENEDPGEEEESNEDQSGQRLSTIHEAEEEHETEQELLNSVSPQSRQRRFLQGRLQEVKIYLNQLPNTYIEQFRGTGNISISVSPPERRSSFQYRSSSIVGDANESCMGNGQLYLEEQLSRSRTSRGEASFDESRVNPRAQLSVSLRRSADFYNASSSNRMENLSEQYSENLSAIHSLKTPDTSTIVHNDSNSLQSDTLQELDLFHVQLQRKTSTPIVSRLSGRSLADRSGAYTSPNRSKNESLAFKTNITKRKLASKERRKVAQVLLNRLSVEKSPVTALEDIVNVPVIRKSTELKKRFKNDTDTKVPEEVKNAGSSDEENNEKQTKNNSKNSKRRKRDSPTQKAGSIAKAKAKTSPPKSISSRPKRAARPKTLKEPNLTKKMRRSK